MERIPPAGNRTLVAQPIAQLKRPRWATETVKVEFGYTPYFASVLNWKAISQINLSWYTVLLFVTFRHFNLHLTFETSFWNDGEENKTKEKQTQQLTWTKSKVITIVVRRREMGGVHRCILWSVPERSRLHYDVNALLLVVASPLPRSEDVFTERSAQQPRSKP